MQTSSLFDHSRNAQIINSHIAVNQVMDSSAVLRFLYEAMAKHAGSGHQDPSTCLEGTRTTALEEIHKWQRKIVEETNPEMIWLTGSAGSGKTAMARSVYERFKAEGLLVVQTAFFRSTGCTNPKYLPLSIAYQLAVANPVLRAAIEAVAQADPAVVDASIDVQLQRLVLEPISNAASRTPMVYVVIDGLDECGVEDQQIQIIQLIHDIVTEWQLPIRFLIASRPESWIRTSLLAPSAPSLVIVFLNQDEEANSDLQLYYKTEFDKIRNDPRHASSMTSAPSPWPSKADIERLVDWASGQFIYAKTVTRFVSEPGYSPICRLELVLAHSSELTKSKLKSPLDRLDTLYSQILSCVVDWDVTANVLGALLVFNPLSWAWQTRRERLSMIEVILGLSSGHAYLALRNLHALVFVTPDLTSKRDRMTVEEYKVNLKNESQYLRFFHKSFTDFLHHPQHANKYFIDEAKSNAMMTIGCLKVLQSVNMTSSTRLFSFTWFYAYHNWVTHCSRSGLKGNHQLLNDLDQFPFISCYFIPLDCTGRQWEKLGLLHLLEKWNDDAQEGVCNIDGTLKNLDIPAFVTIYSASAMWDWFKTQNDTRLRAFPKLRLKLWILHKLAEEDGVIRFYRNE